MMKFHFDLSCFCNPRPTGIGYYANHFLKAFQDRFPEVNLTGSFKVSRWKKQGYISRYTSIPYQPFIPVVSDFLLKNFDVYHGLDFFVPKSQAFKKVVTIHDLAVYQTELWNTKEAEKSAKGLEKVLFEHKPDWVITVSKAVERDFLKQFPLFQGKTTTIYHGAEHFETTEKLPPVFDFPYVFYLGTVEKRKNVSHLVRAFDVLAQGFSDIHLVIAGQAGYGAEETARLIENSKFHNRIHWNTHWDDQTVKRIMSHATVFCYPSLYEGFGIPLVEAMKSGVPIVTSQWGALKEISGEAALHFDPLQSPLELTEKLSLVLSNENVRLALKQNALTRGALFSWKKAAEQAMEVYQHII